MFVPNKQSGLLVFIPFALAGTRIGTAIKPYYAET